MKEMFAPTAFALVIGSAIAGVSPEIQRAREILELLAHAYRSVTIDRFHAGVARGGE